MISSSHFERRTSSKVPRLNLVIFPSCSLTRVRVLTNFAMALVLIVGAASHDVAAASLEGFGPVRFGMTIQEVEDALRGDVTKERSQNPLIHIPESEGIEFRWAVDQKLLIFEVHANHGKMAFDVEVHFKRGRVAYLWLQSRSLPTTPGTCIARGAAIAREIERHHEVSPRVRPGTLGEAFPEVGGSLIRWQVDLYLFSFDHGANIELAVSSSPPRASHCSMYLFFFPPKTMAALF